MPTPGQRYAEGKMMGLRMLEERRRKQLQEAQLRRLTERRGEDYMPVPIGKLGEMGMPLDQFMPQATITPGGATVQMQMGAVDRLMRLLPKKEKILTGEALWLQNHPGKTHEDYQRAMKGITAEFKEPKPTTEMEVGLAQVKKAEKEQTRKQGRLDRWHEKFLSDWMKYQAKIKEEETEGLFPVSQLTYFNRWKEQVPHEHHLALRERLELAKPKKLETVSGKSSREIYNECRDDGGTMEQCKARAGISQ